MNRDNEPSSDTHPAVSAAYRAIATETSPDRLDNIVLREAAAETKTGSRFARYFRSARRPLAFAATLVLALSLVLQFEDELTRTATYSTGGVSRPSDINTNSDDVSAERQGAVRSCNSTQTASAELWWACITDLESKGRYDDAKHERNLLTNTYPDFLPAE